MDEGLGDVKFRLACAAMALAAGGLSAGVPAATLNVQIDDRDGSAVGEVVIYATPIGTPPPVVPAAEPLVMRQSHEQFVPHILVAQAGSAIAFPNEDSVSHHVYSFSKPKKFELPLYKGTAYPPMVFDRTGIVDIGCNIHDRMEAHIVIVDTPYFALSAANGSATITGLAAGDYDIEIYTPRLRPDALPQPVRVTVSDTESTVHRIQFEDRLRPPHEAEGGSLSWSHY